jgi:hypothetical protein
MAQEGNSLGRSLPSGLCLRRAEPCSLEGHTYLLTAQRIILGSVFPSFSTIAILLGQAGLFVVYGCTGWVLHNPKRIASHTEHKKDGAHGVVPPLSFLSHPPGSYDL